jgi:hypothetical protein
LFPILLGDADFLSSSICQTSSNFYNWVFHGWNCEAVLISARIFRKWIVCLLFSSLLREIYIYIYIYVMQIILFSSVEKDFLLDLVNLSLTFYFQSSFGTIDQTEILWQCSSASCYLILFSKNLRRRSSNSWSDRSFWHCPRVILTIVVGQVLSMFHTSGKISILRVHFLALKLLWLLSFLGYCKGILTHLVYGLKSKLKHGNPS